MKTRHRFRRSFVLAAGVLAALSVFGISPPPDPLATRFWKDVTVLAADDMEGRGLGTKGLDRAAAWIEARLKSLGLQPAFSGSFRQPFDVKTGVTLEKGNAIAGVADADWSPLGFSSSGDFAGELAFVGYGIEAAPLDYRELSAAGIDLKGKVALMLRYEPQEKDEKSKFDGRRPSRWSAPRYKVLQARERGAVAVVFVTGPLQDEGKDKLPVLKNDGPESPAGIPVVQVKLSVAQKWLSAAKPAISLAEFQKQVDEDVKPRSAGSTGVRLSGHVALAASYAKAANLAGVLPGKGALANEVVVIGAHYDHLGWGGTGSMKPNAHAIHHGADDNASGTVAVLLAAEEMSAALKNAASRRTVVFALFSAEEVGIAGSSWLVAHPPFPIGHVVAMVNLDMVGQMRNGELIVFGTESAKEWPATIAPLGAAANVKIIGKGDGYGPSDQTAFYAAGIPVLHLFTGAHERYHTPEDTADSLNTAGAAAVVRFTASVGDELALGKISPKYARGASSAAPALAGDSRGYGAYLGTVPDFKAMESTEGGVLLADVRTGGPADKAGIKGGDRILQMAGTKIANLYDMTYALEDHKPGETIDVVVERAGEKKTLKATLGKRKTNPEASGSPSGNPHAAPTPSEWSPSAGKPFGQKFEGERHLADIRQLTFGGENAEAYWSPDGRRVIYQSTPRGGQSQCDQEFVMDLTTGESKRVSSGKGRTTCGYFRYPQGDRIVWASTEGGGESCPPTPDRSKGYTWPIYDSYDIWTAKPDGSDAHLLVKSPGYDAEATWRPTGGKIIFTSDRDGDLDLYEMDEDGKNVKRLTNTPGYDGGAFYSPDGKEITWRASRPQGAELEEYRTLLKQGLIRPTKLDIYVMNADGTNVRRITDNQAANFCPLFTADGKSVMWSSNVGDPKGREFDLWMAPKDGSGDPQRITTAPGFDGFPHFSPDGKWLVWASNRADPASHETNLFIARWVE